MPTLIVEGPDLSGKTTAIENLAKHFNVGIVIKNAYKPKEASDTPKLIHQYNSIIIALEKFHSRFFPDSLVILDRFFPSQLVYSYKRGIDELKDTPKELVDLQDYCQKHGFLYVYLKTSMKELEKRYEERGDEHIKLDELKQLVERYDEYFKICPLSKIEVDTTKKDWIKKVEKLIEESK